MIVIYEHSFSRHSGLYRPFLFSGPGQSFDDFPFCVPFFLFISCIYIFCNVFFLFFYFFVVSFVSFPLSLRQDSYVHGYGLIWFDLGLIWSGLVWSFTCFLFSFPFVCPGVLLGSGLVWFQFIVCGIPKPKFCVRSAFVFEVGRIWEKERKGTAILGFFFFFFYIYPRIDSSWGGME